MWISYSLWNLRFLCSLNVGKGPPILLTIECLSYFEHFEHMSYNWNSFLEPKEKQLNRDCLSYLCGFKKMRHNMFHLITHRDTICLWLFSLLLCDDVIDSSLFIAMICFLQIYSMHPGSCFLSWFETRFSFKEVHKSLFYFGWRGSTLAHNKWDYLVMRRNSQDDGYTKGSSDSNVIELGCIDTRSLMKYITHVIY